ncbi:hypothetical protein BGZ60DRAFT_61017 [Tricladium varicosporioides]|nr:hypothetical protein BGZ60DRAFT_61017 [Hymenoscyphus varicosporioides]
MHTTTIFMSAFFALTSLIAAAPAPIANPISGFAVLDKRTVIVSSNNETATINSSVDLSGLPSQPDSIDGSVDISSIITYVLDKVGSLIQGMIDSDIKRRIQLTQQVVGTLAIEFPGKNIILSNVGYTFTGTPLAKSNIVYNAKVGSDVTFDVIVFNSGTFTFQGDGGFQNVSATCTDFIWLK